MTLVQSLNDLEMEEIADVVLHIIDSGWGWFWVVLVGFLGGEYVGGSFG